MIRFIDLFCGIGGIRLGLEKACKELHLECKSVFSSDIDSNARHTYKLNFSEEPEGDITKVSDFPNFDFLLAGFPCQSFSHAGAMRGFDDIRGTMFFEVARVLRDKRPQGFLLENVRGLLTNNQGQTFKTILDVLSKLGYGVCWRLLNSCNFGIPQNRQRVYIAGLLQEKPLLSIRSDKGPPDSHSYKKTNGGLLFPELSSPSITVKDVLQKNTPNKYRCSDDFVTSLSRIVGRDYSKLNGMRLIDYRSGNSIHSWELGIKGNCSTAEVEFMNLLIANRRKHTFGTHQDGKKLTLDEIKTFYNNNNIESVIESLLSKGYLKRHGDRYNPVCGNMSFEVFKFLDPDSISITLTSSDAHRLGVVQNNIPRRITPRECARLQGFPDSFKIHSKDICAYKQFGNSVSVPVVTAVLKDLISHNASFLNCSSRKVS
jgi:DNA (cytosine-5)-methyltransferase 1